MFQCHICLELDLIATWSTGSKMFAIKKKIKEPKEREMRQKGRRDRRKEEKGDKKREATTYVPIRLMQCLH